MVNSHENNVKVSVLVMAYNHGAYIEQALESVLAQKTAFDFEIIISEDCSTDRTRDIVLDYDKRFPGRFRLLLSAANLKSNEIVARGIRAARGDYIALLDGDDHWTSPGKLQRQADFLDCRPRCAICFHNAVVVYQDASREPYLWTAATQKEESTLEDIWAGNFIATASVMFRNHLIGHIPEWYIPMFPITDWPLHILNAEHGTIGYINEVMSVYRQHAGGLYSPKSEADKQAATKLFYRVMNANLEYRYDAIIRNACSKYFLEWAEEYISRGDMRRARACLLTSLLTGGVRDRAAIVRIIKRGLLTYKSFVTPYFRRAFDKLRRR